VLCAIFSVNPVFGNCPNSRLHPVDTLSVFDRSVS